jgi:shikimate kinase
MHDIAKVVILVGFSTAGKSSILKEIQKRNGEYKYVDTDSEISRAHEGHIYNVFLDKWDENDPINRQKALSFIAAREDEILNDLTLPAEKPTLIAAGPFLHIRSKWVSFTEVTHPDIFHISITPESVYEGLLKRHGDHKKIIGDRRGFGCWDLGVTKKYMDGEYILLDEELAIKNIDKLLSDATSKYRQLSNGKDFTSERLRNDENYRENFIGRVIECLSN